MAITVLKELATWLRLRHILLSCHVLSAWVNGNGLEPRISPHNELTMIPIEERAPRCKTEISQAQRTLSMLGSLFRVIVAKGGGPPLLPCSAGVYHDPYDTISMHTDFSFDFLWRWSPVGQDSESSDQQRNSSWLKQSILVMFWLWEEKFEWLLNCFKWKFDFS